MNKAAESAFISDSQDFQPNDPPQKTESCFVLHTRLTGEMIVCCLTQASVGANTLMEARPRLVTGCSSLTRLYVSVSSFGCVGLNDAQTSITFWVSWLQSVTKTNDPQ